MTDCSRNETPGTLSLLDEKLIAQEFVWATTEEGRLRALSVYMIRSIVERYSGTIEFDSTNDTISISVPKEDHAVCTQEIQKRLGRVCV